MRVEYLLIIYVEEKIGEDPKRFFGLLKGKKKFQWKKYVLSKKSDNYVENDARSVSFDPFICPTCIRNKVLTPFSIDTIDMQILLESKNYRHDGVEDPNFAIKRMTECGWDIKDEREIDYSPVV